MNPIIYVFENEGTEIHMMGDYVGVAWNTKMVKKQFQDASGWVYNATVTVQERVGDPYIRMAMIRTGKDENWLDEDNPTNGGFSIQDAEQISAELLMAVEYMKNLSS